MASTMAHESIIASVMSICSMSLEKRFRIRPSGVTSKNATGARDIVLRSMVWMRLAAITRISALHTPENIEDNKPPTSIAA